MPFQITNDSRVVTLANETNRLEVWPACGFNAYRWQVQGHDLLYRTSEFFSEQKPARSGFPILFPFPNRIAQGHFVWDGRAYDLPVNDPAGKNAIHGFAHSRPWRVVDQGLDSQRAWITGEFQCSLDAPDRLGHWPADCRIRVTYRLMDRTLTITAQVDNPDTKRLPFGLGYHPYFALAPFGGESAIVTVSANRFWPLEANMPIGAVADVDALRDLRHGTSISDLRLDDVLTSLQPIAVDHQDSLGLVGVIQHPDSARMLTLWLADSFREMVVFTPPHREALCLEPYTCTTDAINLSARGIDAGLRVLSPGERWQGMVEIHYAS